VHAGVRAFDTRPEVERRSSAIERLVRSVILSALANAARASAYARSSRESRGQPLIHCVRGVPNLVVQPLISVSGAPSFAVTLMMNWPSGETSY